MTTEASAILATAKRFRAEGQPIVLTTVDGGKYRGYVTAARRDGVKIEYHANTVHAREHGFATFMPELIQSVCLDRAHAYQQ